MTEIETLTEEERDWLQRFRHCPWPDVSRSAADAGVDAGAALRKLLRLHDALQARVKELETMLRQARAEGFGVIRGAALEPPEGVDAWGNPTPDHLKPR